MHKISRRLHKVFASSAFFIGTVIWFVLQSVWIAISGLFPMAFDEKFHFDLINLYSNKLTPFWSSTPAGSESLGALTTDPSYMYHYLLGFPFRIIGFLTKDIMTQVILLRLFSMAFFVLGIWIFRKVLIGLNCSKPVANVVIAMFVATPIVPLLAAQINYDNLLFLVFALSLLYLQKNILSIRKSGKISIKNLFILAMLLMFGSLVKYAYLPFVLGIVIVLIFEIIKGKNHTIRSRTKEIISGLMSLEFKWKLILIVPTIVLFGLCLERYGVNTVKYRTPTPECDQVLSIEKCLANGPWRRNYYTRKSKLDGSQEKMNTNFVNYVTNFWLYRSTLHLNYAINGEASKYYQPPPVRTLQLATSSIMVLGLVLFIINFCKIRKKYFIGPLLLICLIYWITLLLQNYSDFIHLGYPFGIQGRYLIPTLPILYAAILIGVSQSLRKLPEVKPFIAILSIAFIVTQGGGAVTFIIRNDDGWLWNNNAVRSVNNQARTILKPLIIGE